MTRTGAGPTFWVSCHVGNFLQHGGIMKKILIRCQLFKTYCHFLKGCSGISVCFLESELFAYLDVSSYFSLERPLRKCQPTPETLESIVCSEYKAVREVVPKGQIPATQASHSCWCCMLGVGCGFQQKFSEISQNYLNDHKTKQNKTKTFTVRIQKARLPRQARLPRSRQELENTLNTQLG